MKSYMTPAALLSLILTVGCADRGDNSAQNVDENKAPPASEPAADRTPAASDDRGTPTAGTAGARAGSAAPNRAGANRPAARGNAAAPSSSAAPREEPRESAPRETPARVEWREVTIPEGTALPLELDTELSSETAQVETPVRAHLKQAVVVNGVTALPAGAVVSGEVTGVERAGKVKGRSALAFSFNRVQADNLTGNLRTNPLTFAGEASKGEDATKVGVGAVGGAIVGGILGGGSGAAKGAAIGGAAGTGVVLATRGKDVKLAKGVDLAATLAAPFTVRVPAR
jgi:hypothetical protein